MNKQMKITIGLLVVSFISFKMLWGNSVSSKVKDDKVNQEVSIAFNDEELISGTKLLRAVNYFKRLSLTDYEKALMVFSGDKVIKQFEVLNKAIWVQTPPELGWPLFMSAAVHVIGGINGKTPIVGFYYPYADVFLITQWSMKDKIPKIIDVDVVAGDFIRIETEDLKMLPHWLRTKNFKPFALGDSVAKTIVAFENLFGTESILNWRKKIPALKNKEVLNEVNYPISALMIFNNLINIDAFRFADKETNSRLESCRNLTIKTVKSAANQELDKLFEDADKTLSETKKVLKGWNKEWFLTLEVVAALEAQDGCLIFLSPVYDPSGAVTLLFEGRDTKLSLSRIDIVDFSGFFNMNKKNLENKDIDEDEDADEKINKRGGKE